MLKRYLVKKIENFIKMLEKILKKVENFIKIIKKTSKS